MTVGAEAGHGSLTVADTGPGMSPEQAARVFELARFFTAPTAPAARCQRRHAGSGCNPIVATLVAAHGGTVTVDTAPGRGAAFAGSGFP